MYRNNKYLVALIHIIIVCFFTINTIYAKEKNSINLDVLQDKSSYRDIVRLLYKKEYSKGHPEYLVSELNEKKEVWEISFLDNGKQIWIIESHDDGVSYREVYYSKKSVLLYAIDSDSYDQGNVWECEFFIKNGKLYSEISLGHGKTERDDWDPNIIFEMFESRKMELKILQKNK